MNQTAKIDLSIIVAVLLVLAVLLLAGCSTVRYENTTTGDSFAYTRIGAQKISGFTMEPTEGGGFAVGLEGQESDGSAQALDVLAGALIEQSKAP